MALKRALQNRIHNVLLASFFLVCLLCGESYAQDYHFVTKWGSDMVSDGKLYHPKGTATDSSGNIYVADSYNKRIQKFTSDGTFITKWGNDIHTDGQFYLYYPSGVALDFLGNIYIADNHGRIQKFTSDGTFITKWGTSGSGDGQFSSPEGVAVDSAGNVYVADSGNNRIQKFSSDGTFITKWGTSGSGDGQFSSPEGVAVDAAGNVYVTDTYNHRIQKFSSDGMFITKWGTRGGSDGQFQYPGGVALDLLGNIYVAETYRIQKFSSDGTFITKWGTSGSGDGQFYFIWTVSVDSAGNVYVSDYNNHLIQKFTSDGTFITKWGASVRGDGEFDYPIGVAFDSAGSVFVSDYYNNRIQKFSSDGTFITKWGTSGSGDGEFSSIHTAAVDSAGNVYVADSNNHRIQKFSSDGTFITKWGTCGSGDGEFLYPTAVTIDSAGSVFVCDHYNHRIQKFSSDGTFITKWGTSGSGDGQFDGPYSVAVDSAGNVYVADMYNNRIQKFSSDGTFITKWGTSGSGDGQFISPDGVAIDSEGNVYVVDIRIQKFTPDGTFITKWETYIRGDYGLLVAPSYAAVDALGNVYVTDAHNNRVQVFAPYNPAGGSLVPLYRLYRGGTAKNHFYTTNATARDQKVGEGYIYEGIEGFVSNAPFPGSKALQMFHIYWQQVEWSSPLYHASLGTDNFYTTSKYEYQHAVATWGFTDGGIVGFVATRLANNRPQGSFAGVGLAAGNLALPSFTELSLNGVGPQLAFTRYYDSFSPGTTLGQGWSFNYDSYILEDANGVHVQWADGSESHFQNDLTPYRGYFEKIELVDDVVNYGYNITTKDQTVYQFRRLSINDPNNLPAVGPKILVINIIDKHGNKLSLDRQASYGAVMRAFDDAGREFHYEYTPINISDGRTVQRLTRVTDRSLTPNRAVSLAYNTKGNLASVTDSMGYMTAYTYNPHSLLETITYPEGNIVTVTYNSLMQVTGYTNGSISLSFDYQGGNSGTTVRNGSEILFNVLPDQQSRASKVTFANNVADTIEPAYCPGNQLNLRCSVKDRNGNTSYFTYDNNGNLLTATNALNETTTYTYDSRGKNNITSIMDPRGNTTVFTYDGDYRRLFSVRKPLGGTTTYQYPPENDRGLVTSMTNPTGHTTSYTYDAYGNTTSLRDNAIGASIDYTYDYDGRRLTQTDMARPMPQVTTWQYDNNNNIISAQVGANNPSAQFIYDRNNRLTTVIDQRGKTTTYTYNTMNLPATQQSPDQKLWQYGYNSVGNLSSVVLPDGNSIAYAYDADKRLQYVRYNGSEKLYYTYDRNGNVISLRVDGEPGRVTAFVYNPANRIISITDQFGNTIGYGYDAAGNVTSIIYPGSKVVNYTFDADNRLSTVRDWLQSGITTYTYNTAGILQSVNNANGTTTTYGYDTANRLISLANRQANSSSIAGYSLVLDNMGNPTSITRNEPLTQPAPTSANISYTYNDANQIQTVTTQGVGTINYNHDGIGNLSGVSNGRSFTFDYANRLTNATIGGDVHSFSYDGFGNRISRTKNGVHTRYLLDLNTDMSDVLAEMDSGGTVQNYYIHGLGLISRIDNSGQRFTYHFDPIGNTVAVTDDTGNTVNEKYAYDEFGATLAMDPPTINNPFRYVGKHGVMDEGNNLLFMRARYYDADTGRFLSRDPIGFEGGDLNLYAYVGANPLAGVDPLGLDEEMVYFIWMKSSNVPFGHNAIWISDKKDERGYPVGGVIYEIGGQNAINKYEGKALTDYVNKRKPTVYPIDDADPAIVKRYAETVHQSKRWNYVMGRNDCYTFAKYAIELAGASIPDTAKTAHNTKYRPVIQTGLRLYLGNNLLNNLINRYVTK